jgi:tRNA1(Val) A37 N6-methylase TrmN6
MLFTAWSFRDAACTGVEAEEESFRLAKKSTELNGCAGRCDVRHGDLRSVAVGLVADATHSPADVSGAAGMAVDSPSSAAGSPGSRRFDLVTGTPPYFEVKDNSALPASLCYRPRLFEFRGGVEAYCEAASHCVAPGGAFVVCETANHAAHPRVRAAAAASGFVPVRRFDVAPKQGKPPLFAVWVLVKASDADMGTAKHLESFMPAWDAVGVAEASPAEAAGQLSSEHVELITVRALDGQRTDQYKRLLATLEKPG